MRDSSVVYVNEALYYYFSFIFYYLPFYSFTLLPHNKSALQFKRFIYTFKSNQSGIGFAKKSKFLFLYVFH